MSALQTLVQSIHPLSEKAMEAFIHSFESVHCKKKAYLTRQGETEQYMYFVEEGVQRSFYSKDGKDHTIAFTYPPSFSGIPESFIGQRPSHYFLQCITDSQLLRISYDRLQELVTEYRDIETFMRKSTEFVLIGLLERQYELLALNMEERFRVFVKRSPHLLNLVPHKHLASYLRIDPTNFSKLLNSIKI